MRNIKTAERAFEGLATKVRGQNVQIKASVEASGFEKAKQQAKLQNDINDEQTQNLRNLARERYALYDVAAAYGVVGAAAFGALTTVAKAAIEFERAFANVDRTTEFTSAKVGEAARVMKYELMQIASEIPVAFGKVTEIATIGNQLGIAQGNLEQFTKTVAMFSATTGMTAEATAMGLGRVVELLSDPTAQVGYEQLGAAIAYAGVKAVATEEQIVSTTKEIATTAKMAKFAAPDVVGLATALASVGVAPEAARGSIIRAFAGINKAISENGAGLQQYARISGMTAQEFASQWTTNGQVAFNAFLKGLQSMSQSGQNLDTVLRDLGMVNVRDIQTIQKLGDNYDIYAESIRNANQAYQEGTFLGEAYGKIQDTVAAKLELLQNNWNNLLATLGEGAIGDTFKAILDSVNETLKQITEFIRTPLAQSIAPWIMAGLGFVGVVASINAVLALAKASTFAYAIAMGEAVVATEVLGNGVQQTTLKLNKARVASVALNTALKTMVPIAILSAGLAMFQKISEALSPIEMKAENILGGFGGLQDALTQDAAAYQDALKATGDASAASAAAGVFMEVEAASNDAATEAERLANNARSLNEVFGITTGAAGSAAQEVDDLTFVLGANTAAWIRNALVQSDTFQELIKNDEAIRMLKESGFNLQTALEAAASGNLDVYLEKIGDNAVAGKGSFEQLEDVASRITEEFGFLGTMMTWLLAKIKSVASIFGIDLTPFETALKNTGTAIKGTVNQAALLGPLLDGVANGASGAADGIDELGNESDKTSGQLRTVIDYANDLSGILSRITELEFGKQIGRDSIAKGWNEIKESASDATEQIKKANDEIKDLTADRSILEYQLSVAERYGDEARAAKIRAQLAKNTEQQAAAEKRVADATKAQDKNLTGTSESAMENRASLLGMVSTYQDYVTMLAKLGRKPKDLAADIQVLKGQFEKNAIAAGFSRDQLGEYLGLFDQFSTTAQTAPRDVDVEVNANLSPAEQAIAEFVAKQRSTTVTTKADTSGATGDVESFASKQWRLKNVVADRVKTDQAEAGLQVWLSKGRTLSVSMKFDSKSTVLANAASALQIARKFPTNSTMYTSYIEMYRELLKVSRSFATGGYVSGPGTGTSDSIPARLSNGEFVVKASAVGAYGVDFLNALNQQKVAFSTSGGSTVMSGGGATIAYLSPEDRALLRAVADRPVNLYSDNVKIAEAANSGNTLIARRGAR
jgi:TP901 family phage tail tape measure protein